MLTFDSLLAFFACSMLAFAGGSVLRRPISYLDLRNEDREQTFLSTTIAPRSCSNLLQRTNSFSNHFGEARRPVKCLLAQQLSSHLASSQDCPPESIQDYPLGSQSL